MTQTIIFIIGQRSYRVQVYPASGGNTDLFLAASLQHLKPPVNNPSWAMEQPPGRMDKQGQEPCSKKGTGNGMYSTHPTPSQDCSLVVTLSAFCQNSYHILLPDNYIKKTE